MKLSITLCLSAGLAGLLVACGGPRLQDCRIDEIEDAEFEVDIGDVDIERGEVEMTCGRRVIDVRWSEFRRKLDLDPGRYRQDLRGFQRQVRCGKPRREDRVVWCKRGDRDRDYARLKFSDDD